MDPDPTESPDETGHGGGGRGIDLVNGPVFSTTIRLAGPVVLSHFLNLALGMADMIMVGVLGKDALAGLVIANSLIMLLFAIGFGASFATITYVSQHTGAGRDERARRSASHSLMFALVLGVLMIAIGNLFLPDLIGFFNSEMHVTKLATIYADIFFDYMPFFFLIFLGGAIMQGVGDTRTPMFIMAFINVVNILLNYMLIFGAWGAPRLGIAGAAVGSVSARGVGSLIILALLVSGSYRMRLRTLDFRPYASEFWGLIRLAVPYSVQSLMRNLNVILLYRVLSLTYLPTVAQASLGVGFQAEGIAFIPLMGLIIGSGAMVGQNLGAGKPDRAEQAGWAALRTALCLMVIACLAFFTIPEKIVGLFTSNPSVIHSGAWYLRINAIGQVFQSCFVLVGCLRGAGDNISPLLTHITGQWIIRLPLAYYLAEFSGLEEWGVWLAMATSAAIECMIYYWLFRRGAWKKMRIY